MIEAAMETAINASNFKLAGREHAGNEQKRVHNRRA